MRQLSACAFCVTLRREVRPLNKMLIGFSISAVGIVLFALTVLKIIPVDTKNTQLLLVAVSWVFIIIGSVMRYKAVTKQHKEWKENQNKEMPK